MRRVLLATLLLVSPVAVHAADVNDSRMAVVLTPDIRAGFLEEMRGHMDSLDAADVADAMPANPGAGDWARVVSALANLSSHCRGCHAAFRVQ